MKSGITIPRSPEDRISWGLLAGFLLFLPFYRFYSELLLIFFCLHTLLHVRSRPFADVSVGRILLLQSAFLLSLLSMAWTPYPVDGWSKVGRQLAIFLFPLLFCLTRLDLRRYRDSLMRVFALVCTGTIAYLFFDALRVIRGLHLPWSAVFSPAFSNQQFSEPIRLHATCLAMYAALSLAHLLLDKGSRVLRIACGAILLAGLVQLEARSVLIGTAVAVLAIVPFGLPARRVRARYWLVSGTLALLLGLGLGRDRYFRTRLVDGLADDLRADEPGSTHLESRMTRWEVALDLIRRAPLAGFGTGAEVHELDAQYFKRGMYRSYLVHLNAHNQFLSMALDSGLGGPLLLAAVLLAGAVAALRRRDFLFLSFLALIACTGCSEDILDVNKGIFFYAFFFSLFSYDGHPA